MRIVHVSSDPGIGPGRKKGATVHIAAMRRAFAAAGAEVFAVDAADDDAVSRALAVALAQGEIDLVYERYALDRFAAAGFARARGIPFVLEVNAPLAEEERHWRGGTAATLSPREREVFASAAAVLAVSSEVARYAIERGSHPDRTLVRANAVDPMVFRPRPPGDPLRAHFFPPEALVVGFHGRLRPWHNLPLLAEALAILLAEGLPVYFFALGEGPFDEALQGRVPVSRRVQVPWVPHEEAASYVACFDVLALSYAADECCYFSPLKLLEAMATGAVPVVPDLGDLPEIVGHGSRGIVVAPGSAVEIARAIRGLACDPVAFRRLSAAARRHAETHTWSRMARELLDLAGAGNPS